MVEALIFDIGNVLVSFDWDIAKRRLKERGAFPELMDADFFQKIIKPYETGKMETQEFLETVGKMIKFPGKKEELADILSSIFSDNQFMESLVCELGKKYPLYLLSNTSSLHWNLLQKRSVFKYFKDGVFSFVAHAMKPEADIFHTAIQQFGVNPSRTIYADDLEANIQMARLLGFKSFQYSMLEHEKFEKFLESELS